MQTITLKPLVLLLALLSLSYLLTACQNKDDTLDEETSKLDPYVDTPAYPILEDETSLHIFTVANFKEDKDGDSYGNIYEDQMELFIDSFTQAYSTEEPDDDADVLSTNDLGYIRLKWVEVANPEKDALLFNMGWYTDEIPLQDSRYTQNDRDYRILKNGSLQPLISSDYMPIYEAIDENIYERRQSVTFVWDLGGSADIDSEEDVSNDDIDDWESVFYARLYTILPNASVWASDSDDEFSEGAKIIGGTRSIAEDIMVIEAVYDNGEYNMDLARFSSGENDIATALEEYSSENLASVHLNYQFTEDFFYHHFIYMQFDTELRKAFLFTNNDATEAEKIVVDYHEYLEDSYIEIDLSALDKDTLDGLNLPAYFNPIIAGPFGEDNDYYYGKHYVKTDGTQRLKLDPIFFLNDIAKNDVQTAFEDWRRERHEEEAD